MKNKHESLGLFCFFLAFSLIILYIFIRLTPDYIWLIFVFILAQSYIFKEQIIAILSNQKVNVLTKIDRREDENIEKYEEFADIVKHTKPLFIRLYRDTIVETSEIYNRIALQTTNISIVAAGYIYILNNTVPNFFSYFQKNTTLFFLYCFLLASITLIASIVYLLLAMKTRPYKTDSTAQDIYNLLKQGFRAYYNQKEPISLLQVRNEIDLTITKNYIEFATHNRLINQKRFKYLSHSTNHIIASLIFLFVSYISFCFIK